MMISKIVAYVKENREFLFPGWSHEKTIPLCHVSEYV